MNKVPKTRIFIGMVCLLGAVCLQAATPGVAMAQSSNGSSSNSKPRNQDRSISPSTYRSIQRMQQLMSKKKYNQAIKVGKTVLPRATRDSNYAQAIVEELIANSYMAQKEYDPAKPYLQKIIKLDALQSDQQTSVIQQLANIYLMQNDYTSAIHLYEQVLSSYNKKGSGNNNGKSQPGPDLYYDLGMAYSYRAEARSKKSNSKDKPDYQKALNYIKKGVKMKNALHEKDPAKNDAADKDWYQSWFVMAYRLNDYKQSREVAKTMVSRWPTDADLWNYYANSALMLHDDGQATAIYGIMYRRNMLSGQDDYLQYANLLLEQKAPYKAAEVIAKGLDKGVIKKTKDNYDTLASAWIAAREWDKALDTLGKEAKLASSGSVYLRQAEIYLNRTDYGNAHKAAQQAIQKGNLKKDTGKAWMALGQASYHMKNYDSAIKAFHSAEKYKSVAQDAENWIKYVKSAQGKG